MQIGEFQIIMLVFKIMGTLLALTYSFYAIVAYRNISLVNKVVGVSIYPLFKIFCLINIILGIAYLLFVIFV